MKKVIIFVLFSAILVGCGGATPDISAEDMAFIQTQAVQDAIATMTAQARAATATPTSIPAPTSTPIPRPTNTPTKTPTPLASATPIELVSYENEQLAVVLKYPSDCNPRFSLPDPNFGEGELYIECEDGLVALLLQWMPSSDDMTLEEEAEPHMGVGQVLISHEPFAIGGELAYLTEWKWRDVHWLTVKTRYQGYFYRFNWRGESYEKVVTLFDLMLSHIRFVSAPVALPTPTATPQPPTPTALPPTPTPLPPTPTALPSTGEWHEIARWEGAGIKTTEQFYVDGDFRVSWSASGIVRDGYDVFQIMVYQNGEFHSVAANFMGLDTTDASYVYTGGGSFHLVINSTMNWVVTVEVR